MTPASRVDDRTLLTGLPHLLRQAERAVVALFADELAGLTTQPLAYEDLLALALAADHGPVAMNEVVDAVRLAGPSATRLVDRLVAANLLQRAVDDADRRRVVVRLTPRGEKLLPRLREAEARVHERLLEAWTEPRTAALLRALDGVSG